MCDEKMRKNKHDLFNCFIGMKSGIYAIKNSLGNEEKVKNKFKKMNFRIDRAKEIIYKNFPDLTSEIIKINEIESTLEHLKKLEIEGMNKLVSNFDAQVDNIRKSLESHFV